MALTPGVAFATDADLLPRAFILHNEGLEATMKSLIPHTTTIVPTGAARAAAAHAARAVCAPADPVIIRPLGINGAGAHATRTSACAAGPIPCLSKED